MKHMSIAMNVLGSMKADRNNVFQSDIQSIQMICVCTFLVYKQCVLVYNLEMQCKINKWDAAFRTNMVQ